MASDNYLQIDGIKGESADHEHKDWIEVLSYSHEMSQPASATANSSGASVARTHHEDFTITKYMDLASPKLYELCSSGKHIKKVVVELMRSAGDKRVKYMSIEMDEVIVSNVKTASSGPTDLPRESVAFNYGKILWKYTQQKRADGGQGGNVSCGWDLTSNKAAA